MAMKVVDQKRINELREDKDKDLIIADLLTQLAEKDRRLSDLELIVADILGGSN